MTTTLKSFPAFQQSNVSSYTNELNNLLPIELADLLQERSLPEQILIVHAISSGLAVKAFEYLPFSIQQPLISHLDPLTASHILNHLAPDDRTSFLSALPDSVRCKFIKYLNQEEQRLALKLLSYPEGSVGRLMTPDYLTIRLNWKIQEVLTYIRQVGKDSETINVIYVTDNRGVLLDDLRIRELLLAPLDNTVAQIADNKFVALSPQLDQEQAVHLFRKYNRTVLPVIDEHKHILGIVTLDDILYVVDLENTEDIQKIGGITALEAPYMKLPFSTLIQKRVGWLCVLFIGEMLTTSVMSYFEVEIQKAVVLALFIPLIISSGGNAGSQASTLIIRALALKEISIKNSWQIFKREFGAGLVLGSVLGTIGFARIALWATFSDMYGPNWALVGLTVFFALIGVVLWGSLTGSMFPLILKQCKLDPATSSAPLVATLVDVVGILIYFSLAILLLQNTLLG